MTTTGRKTMFVVVRLIIAGIALLSATRFAAPVAAQETATAVVSTPREADQELQSDEKKRAEVTKEFSREFRLQATFDGRGDDFISAIGGLVKSSYWTKNLLLAKVQADTIMKLDRLLWDARTNSILADADYLDKNPADYAAYIKRANARRSDTLDHAESMLQLGLLTEPQVALVIQQMFSKRDYIPNVLRYRLCAQELLGITERQKEMIANARGYNEVAEEILTHHQRDVLSRITTQRIYPAELPDLPELSDDEAARIKLENLSPTFRDLAKKREALELSVEQKRLLTEFEDVTRVGLFLINHTGRQGPYLPGDSRNEVENPIGQMRTKFLKHAEQVVMLGILTEGQGQAK